MPTQSLPRSLALGTAQLGANYVTDAPTEDEARRVLKTAWNEGIRYYDTAQAYGVSEERLGRYLPPSARVITKLHPDTTDDVGERLTLSERHLRRPIWAALLHRDRMLANRRTMSTLNAWKNCGKIKHIGISVEAIESAAAPLDVVQAPASVFDHRLRHLRLSPLRLFIRSVYCRGLAVDDPLKLIEALKLEPIARNIVDVYADFCSHHHISRQQFAIDYVRHRFPGATLVLGAETAEQVRQNCRAFRQNPVDLRMYDEWDQVWRSLGEPDIDLAR